MREKDFEDQIISKDSRKLMGFRELVHASEIAFQNGSHHLAILAMEEAVGRPEATALAYFRLAVLHWQVGNVNAAIAACHESISLDAEDEQSHRLLVELLVESRLLDEAAKEIQRFQKQRQGQRSDLEMILVSAFVAADRLDDALEAIQHYNDSGPVAENAMIMEAEIAHRLGRTYLALSAAERAYRKAPCSPEVNKFYLACLLGAGCYDEALTIVKSARTKWPKDASIVRIATLVLIRLDRRQLALQMAIEGLHIDSSDCESWFNAAMLADSLGFVRQTREMFQRALQLAPENTALYLEFANILGRDGEYDCAITLLDKAESLAPGQETIVSLRRALMERRAHPKEQVANLLRTDDIRPLPRSGRKRNQGVLARLATQLRVISALVMRELQHRAIYSKFGLGSVLLPPILQIGAVGIIMGIFNDGRPPLGDRMFFFYATGLMPFYMFLHVVDHSLEVFAANISTLQVPIIHRLDLVIAVAVAELTIGTMTSVMLFGLFQIFSYGPSSDNQIEAVFAYLATWLIGFGCGLIFAVLNNFSRFFTQIWLVTQRTLYFLSGVFFIPQMMPGWMRDPLLWNPLLQCIEWFRTGFYSQYHPPWINKPYVIGLGCAFVVLGLGLESALRNKMKIQ